MKILTNMVIAVALILIIVTVGIYFLPNHYAITNTIEINKPADVVYSQISDFNNWAAWNPWREMEPDAKYTVENPAGTIGHRSSWEGKKLGTGVMTISAFTPNRSVNQDLQFTSMKMSAKSSWVLDGNGDKTTVTWTTQGGLKYPFGRLWGLAANKMMGGTQQHGLENLKKVCEAIPAPVALSDTTASASK